MFRKGDKVIYPHHGAAVIEGLTERDFLGEKKKYFVLKLAYGDLKLMVPVDNTEEVGLREEESRMPSNWSRRYKTNIEKIRSGDIYQVAEVVRNLSIREAHKGLSAGEKRMLAKARQILISELVFAVDATEDKAGTMIDKVLEEAHGGVSASG